MQFPPVGHLIVALSNRQLNVKCVKNKEVFVRNASYAFQPCYIYSNKLLLEDN